MDSGEYSAPPSFSSGGSRGIDPQFPAYYNHPAVTVDQYATQAPSLSSTTIRNTDQPQFPTDGQRLATDEYHVQAPSYSGFQHTGNSINGYTNDRGLDQSINDGQAPDHNALVHVNNSATAFNDFNGSNGYVQAPSLSGVTPRNPSNPGGSTGSAAFDPLENVGFSIVGRNFPRQNLMGPYNY